MKFTDIENEVFKLIQNVATLSDDDSKKKWSIEEKRLCTCIDALISKCTHDKFTRVEIPYEKEDFPISDKVKYLSLLELLLREFNQSNLIIDNEQLQNVIVDIFYICAQYYNPKSCWSNEECSKFSESIINILVKLSKCNTISELIYGRKLYEQEKKSLEYKIDNIKIFSNEKSISIFRAIVTKCSSEFDCKNWKKFPFYIDIYSILLENIYEEEHMYKSVYFFLPPALFFLDDWEIRHKVLGLQSLNQIIDKHNHSDLRLFGRAEVIYDSLKKQIFTRDKDLLSTSYPPLIKICSIIENDPKIFGSLKRNTFDEVMDHLLREIMYEQKPILCDIYMTHLHQITIAMQINALRWSNGILEVCSSYLATYEEPLAENRLYTLQILKTFIKQCWPRIDNHIPKIMKIICKLSYSINKNKSSLDEQVLLKLQDDIQSILNMLHKSNPKIVKGICQPMKHMVLQDSPNLKAVQDLLSPYYSSEDES